MAWAWLRTPIFHQGPHFPVDHKGLDISSVSWNTNLRAMLHYFLVLFTIVHHWALQTKSILKLYISH